MSKNQSWWRPRPARSIPRPSYSRRLFRRAQLEPLEERHLLSAVPTLDVPEDVTVVAGAPLHIALNGFDADGDALTFSATSDNAALRTLIPEGNRSLRISVEQYGDMVFELFEDRVPRTTARIIELANTPREGQPEDSGFYDGLIFHRVINGFMIQGGDPKGDGTGGSGVDFDDEFHPDLMHTGTGVLAMAKSRDDTNDSQFYITSQAKRPLDFNHTVFGFQTEGDDVRRAIENVLTNEKDKPLTDVVMSSVEVFTDVSNGVLMLAAPEDTTGQASVTVTVSDGKDGTATKTIEVDIVSDVSVNNSRPYLLPMADLHTTGNTPVPFAIPARDPEDDAIYYGAWPRADWGPFTDLDLEIDLDNDTGEGLVTLINASPGVHGILVGVIPETYADIDWDSDPVYWSTEETANWDFQFIPLFIDPPAPTGVELLAGSDTGSSQSDGLTSLNNATDDDVLQFSVSGTWDEAEVSVFADGILIGQKIASGDSVVVTTDGTTGLADGVRAITARQALPDQTATVGNREDLVATSQPSDPIEITVDTTVEFLSTPVTNAPPGKPYLYDVQTDDEVDGEVAYSLIQSPADMAIDESTGEITWTPQVGQGLSQTVIVLAADAAGNQNRQQFTLQINDPPVLQPIGNQQVAESTLLTFTARATDADDPDSRLVYTLAGNVPAGATMDRSSGVFRWTPSEAQGDADYPVTVEVTDARGATASETITITVAEVNQPPVLAAIEDRTIDEGQLLEFTVEVDDPDIPSNPLTFSLGGDVPAGAQLDASTGQFSFRPDESQGGNSYTIVVRVTDGLSPPVEESFTIHVNEVDRPPVFAAVDAQFVRPGEDLELVVRASDPDLPAREIRYSLVPGAPQDAQIDPTSGLLTWRVPEDVSGQSAEIIVRATEMTEGGPGLSSQAVVKVLFSDLGDLAMAVAAGPGTVRPMIAPPPVLPLAMFEATAEEAAPGLRFDFAAAPQAGGGGFHSDMFGTRFGDRGGGGGTRPPAEPQPDDRQPSDETPVKRAEGVEEVEDESDKNARLPKRTPTATDAALERLAEDGNLAAVQRRR